MCRYYAGNVDKITLALRFHKVRHSFGLRVLKFKKTTDVTRRNHRTWCPPPDMSISNTYAGVCGAGQVVKAGSSVPANLTELGLVVLDGGMLESYSTLTGVKETKVTGSDANAAQGAGQGTFGCCLGQGGLGGREGREAGYPDQAHHVGRADIVVDVCLFCMLLGGFMTDTDISGRRGAQSADRRLQRIDDSWYRHLMHIHSCMDELASSHVSRMPPRAPLLLHPSM
jgi:hypothetical protein